MKKFAKLQSCFLLIEGGAWVLILVMAIVGFATGYLAAVLRHGDTKCYG